MAVHEPWGGLVHRQGWSATVGQGQIVDLPTRVTVESATARIKCL